MYKYDDTEKEVEIPLGQPLPQYVSEPDKSKPLIMGDNSPRDLNSYEVKSRYYSGGYENYVREVDTNDNSYKYGAENGSLYNVALKNGVEMEVNHRCQVTKVIGANKDHETEYKYDNNGEFISKNYVEYDKEGPSR